MGAAYRTSARTAPIMDEIAVHPYPAESTDPIIKGYQWPNAGFVEPRPDQAGRLGRLPRHRPAGLRRGPLAGGGRRLTLRIDEIAWQTAIPASSAGAYQGVENVAVTDDADAGRDLRRPRQAVRVRPLALARSPSSGSSTSPTSPPSRAAWCAPTARCGPRTTRSAPRSPATGGSCTVAPSRLAAHDRRRRRQAARGASSTPRPATRPTGASPRPPARTPTYRAGIFPVSGRGQPTASAAQRPARARASRASPRPLLASPARVEGLLRAARPVPAPSTSCTAGWYVYAIRLTCRGRPRPDELLPEQAVPRRPQEAPPRVLAPPAGSASPARFWSHRASGLRYKTLYERPPQSSGWPS